MVKMPFQDAPQPRLVPLALVTAVETDHIPGQQSPHQSGEGNFAPPQKKVSMIR